MFQVGFEFGQYQGEIFGGVYYLWDDFFWGVDEIVVVDVDEGFGVGQFFEQLFYLGRVVVVIWLFDEDVVVCLQVFYFDFLGNFVYVLVLVQLFFGFEVGIVVVELEFGGDGWIDEGFEDFGDGVVDQYFCFGDDLCDGSYGKFFMGVGKGVVVVLGGCLWLMVQVGYFLFRVQRIVVVFIFSVLLQFFGWKCIWKVCSRLVKQVLLIVVGSVQLYRWNVFSRLVCGGRLLCLKFL